MNNYSQIEKLDIAWKAAEAWWTAWDMMWAGIWMAMWMNMAKEMWNNDNSVKQEKTPEQKLEKIKWFLDKKLISQEDYDKKKADILANM
jgi:hypothetical protein